MYLLYFLIWVIFNGQFTLEIALIGLVVAGAVYAFTCKFLYWSPHKDYVVLCRGGLILRYVGVLIWEIVKANAATTRLIAAPDLEPDPVIVRFRTGLKTPTARVILANSITLTPGTITVSVEDDLFTVHCLDRSFAQGIDDTVFERELRRLEAAPERKEERA